MTVPNSSQGQGVIPLTMTQSGLPTLAPAPSQHTQPIQTSQIQQLHSGISIINYKATSYLSVVTKLYI